MTPGEKSGKTVRAVRVLSTHNRRRKNRNGKEHAVAGKTTRNYPRDMGQKLDKMSHELRRDMQKLGDPTCRTLFETAAEVILGLKTAFEHYDAESEQVWK